MEPFPNGAKGKPVRLPMTESALAGMKSPPDVIVCANDDMALGALVALKSGNLIGKVALIGFDALP
jgi:inositol transport system substrate-binding protein